MLKRINIQLLLILIVALVLRQVGVNHDFPLILHPDEPAVIRSALGLRFDPNPHHFDWPHLYFYLNFFLFISFAKLRNILEAFNFKAALPILWNEPWIFYLLSRILSGILGAFTIIPIYLAAKELFNKKIGLLSALAFALLPYHVRDSQFALIDVPMVFFLAWGIYFSTKIYNTQKLIYYILSGLFIGLSMSTKYNGALGSLSIILAYLLPTTNIKNKLRDIKNHIALILSGIFLAIGFLAGTPFALITYQTFLRTDGPVGALWQFHNVGKVSIIVQFQQFITAVFGQVAFDTGYVSMYLMIVGLILILIKIGHVDRRKILFFAIPAILFLYYVSGFSKNRSHYYMIAYPYISILGAYFVSYFVDLFKTTKYKYGAKILLTAFVIIPLTFCLFEIYSLLIGDTRIDLYKWMQSNLTASDKLYYSGNNIEVVMHQIKRPAKKVNVSIDTHVSGYLITETSSKQMVDKIFDNKIKLIQSVSADYRYGPSILIYSLNK